MRTMSSTVQNQVLMRRIVGSDSAIASSVRGSNPGDPPPKGVYGDLRGRDLPNGFLPHSVIAMSLLLLTWIHPASIHPARIAKSRKREGDSLISPIRR